ncbi:hypothetical protein BACCAP_00063 [Pseudoflavonifractor capillosus ATCC 29799]|uniref:Uncharacterized protein n=1 Tax=Pseudoflavonifractor capillosus ATCC 29799 TaxID=411467 RepID=A6NPE8_9FIRM|nr:hypothetical protein BACCAP_00063 [Pseudoflavonifractor capillosus ATCC 29799]
MHCQGKEASGRRQKEEKWCFAQKQAGKFGRFIEIA